MIFFRVLDKPSHTGSEEIPHFARYSRETESPPVEFVHEVGTLGCEVIGCGGMSLLELSQIVLGQILPELWLLIETHAHVSPVLWHLHYMALYYCPSPASSSEIRSSTLSAVSVLNG